MSLLEEYGVVEFSDRVVGCMLEYNGKPTLTRRLLNNGGVEAYAYSGSPEKVVKETVIIPTDYFQSMANLKHPQLGYRTAAAGQYLTYMSRIPTATKKGLHPGQIKSSISQLTDYLVTAVDFNSDHFEQPDARALLVFRPELMSWREGLRKVREGNILSFIVDENFACVPASRANQYMSILYRERLIGNISERGDIEIVSTQAMNAWRKATEDRTYAAG